ncbi:MAG TPA: c-type cytochrome [Polyangia bacterium]|jgi:mono/diheme cytochrome c family protein|nr:c-type cytochrome [Polyangia bacterium]
MSVRPPSSNARRSSLAAAAGLLATLELAGACAGRQRGATPENLAHAQSAAPNGAALFKTHCAGCHGQRGESVGRAPRILGPGALPKYPAEQNLNADPAAGDPELLRLRAQTRPAGAASRDPFSSAQELFQFVSKNMPRAPEKPGSLQPEEYWAIINFMLIAHGVDVPPGGVNAQNASSVKL